MKFITRIPTHLNDGTPVDGVTMERIRQMFFVAFGGYTTDAVSEGGWRSDDGQDYVEPSVTVSCVCDRLQYTEARELVVEIGRMLDQEAMYFEIQYFDGVEIIPVK